MYEQVRELRVELWRPCTHSTSIGDGTLTWWRVAAGRVPSNAVKNGACSNKGDYTLYASLPCCGRQLLEASALALLYR